MGGSDRFPESVLPLDKTAIHSGAINIGRHRAMVPSINVTFITRGDTG
jgi:hypothetical protein